MASARYNFVRNCIIVVVAALAMVPPARAQNDSAVMICRSIVDRAAELIRAGETWRARQMKPQVQRCGPILKAELERAAREIVKRHDDMVRRSKGQSI
jgi:hypothetical protein